MEALGPLWQTFVAAVALFAATALVSCLTLTTYLYLRLARRNAHWPPAPAPISPVGDGPYRSAAVDQRLHRRPPRAVRVATFAALLFGQIALVAASVNVVFCVLLAARAESRPDLLLGKSLAVTTGVVIAAAVQLLRSGPVMLRGDAIARRAAERAASWATGMGILLFAVLFAVLAGALGQHEGWLCLILLGSSLGALTVGTILRRAIDAIPDPDAAA